MELTKEQHAKIIVDQIIWNQSLYNWSAEETLKVLKDYCEGVGIKPSHVFTLYFRQ